MTRTIEIKTTVLPGSRIEITDPGLPEGREATVLITLYDEPGHRSFRENLGGYGGGRLFASAQEVESYLTEERDSWE
jgi:hypothetical protein